MPAPRTGPASPSIAPPLPLSPDHDSEPHSPTAATVAVGQPGQQSLTLLVAAGDGEERRHCHRRQERPRRALPSHLLHDDGQLLEAVPLAAVAFGHVHAEPAQVGGVPPERRQAGVGYIRRGAGLACVPLRQHRPHDGRQLPVIVAERHRHLCHPSRGGTIVPPRAARLRVRRPARRVPCGRGSTSARPRPVRAVGAASLCSGLMVKLSLSYEMRIPDFGPPGEALYEAALDQCEWADGLGFDSVTLSEHHASPDGYMPSPLIMASAVGARTKRMRISISLILLPFYHPHRLAEDAAVCDLICGGRLDLMFGAGYREEEFDMYGLDLHRAGPHDEGRHRVPEAGVDRRAVRMAGPDRARAAPSGPASASEDHSRRCRRPAPAAPRASPTATRRSRRASTRSIWRS